MRDSASPTGVSGGVQAHKGVLLLGSEEPQCPGAMGRQDGTLTIRYTGVSNDTINRTVKVAAHLLLPDF